MPKLSEKVTMEPLSVWPPPVKTPSTPLLPPQMTPRPTLVLDLDETLVYSSYRHRTNVDLVLPECTPEDRRPVYVAKRPHVDQFIQRVSSLYECVLFTAAMGDYANLVVDQLLDPTGSMFSGRLFRHACAYYEGNYVKDLRVLGRKLTQVAIVDNSPAAYHFQPRNGIAVTTWQGDPEDTELLRLIPFLEKLAKVANFYTFLTSSNQRYIN